jgi:hypothetical protein
VHGERRDVSPEIAVAQTAGRCRGERRRGEGVIVKYDYVKLVLSAPPRLVDAFGTRVWRRAGSLSFGSISKGQAQSRRAASRWCCEEALPFRKGTVLDTAPLHSFPRAICPRAPGAAPTRAIDSPRAPCRQPSHICHRLTPRPLPTCNRSRPAQTMIKALRDHRRLGTSSLVD